MYRYMYSFPFTFIVHVFTANLIVVAIKVLGCMILCVLTDSRILIGSVSRLNLWKLLDDQLKGLYDHAREIKLRQT